MCLLKFKVWAYAMKIYLGQAVLMIPSLFVIRMIFTELERKAALHSITYLDLSLPMRFLSASHG